MNRESESPANPLEGLLLVYAHISSGFFRESWSAPKSYWKGPLYWESTSRSN